MLEIVMAGAGREQAKLASMRARASETGVEIDRAVAEIMRDVKARGFDAVKEYSLRFDKSEPMEIDREELRRAAQRIPLRRGRL